MDPLSFLTAYFILFSLGVMAVMYIFRTVVEYFINKTLNSKLWNSLLLPILPIVFGGLGGRFISIYPYGFVGTAGHVLFGAVAGLLSGLLFKVIKELLGGRITQMLGAVAGNNTTVVNVQPTVIDGEPQVPPPQQ